MLTNPEQPATPLEILESHDREILIKVVLNIESGLRDWVHISGTTTQNYIGTGATQKLSSTAQVRVFPPRHRCEDYINNSLAMFPVEVGIKPEFKVGPIRFLPWLKEVPLEYTCIYAPQRIQLGRRFIRDYVASINMNEMTLKLHSHGFVEEVQFEWRRSDT